MDRESEGGNVWAIGTTGFTYWYSFDEQDWVLAAQIPTGLSMASVADVGNIWVLEKDGIFLPDKPAVTCHIELVRKKNASLFKTWNDDSGQWRAYLRWKRRPGPLA